MGKKILIVEDEKGIAETLALKLHSVGFEVVSARDGETAITVLKESPFDLILLDLILPQKDGFSVLAEIRKLKIKAPVIVSSNLDDEEYINRAKKLGAQDFFIKANTTLAEVVVKVNQTLA